jgi:predicted ATP-dependent endonuclease of OLD family
MQLIRKIQITRFRSIRESQLDDLGHFNSMAGLNNAGKSNFLRALNAFFVGNVEHGVRFNIDRDYYRPEIKSKKKKTIRVSVTFELPTYFKFRSGLEPVEDLLGRNFVLTKVWTRDQSEPLLYLNNSNEALSLENSQRVASFLNLITFRYIPNRVIPTDIIVREHQALRDVLVRRLAKYKVQADAVFNGIKNTADQLTGALSGEISKFAPDIDGLRLSTARSLADLAFKFGYLLQEGAVEMGEDEQGSGLQSLLMFKTLYLIDQDYFQKFGWKQAAIWAIEEPESSLHMALEAKVACFLAQISGRPTSRLQTVVTTHSDLIIQYSDSSYIVEKNRTPSSSSPLSTVAEKLDRKTVLKKAARLGISRWVNPILLYYLEPIVLVEGKYDRDYLNALSVTLGKKPRYRIVCLEDLLDNPDKGGIETLKKYIRENVEAIRVRASDAPVIIVLDWEAANKVSEFERIFKDGDPCKIISWNDKDANPLLDKTFRGVERFFSDRLIAEAEKTDASLIAEKKNGKKCIQADDLKVLKRILNGEVKKGLEEIDCAYSKKMIEHLISLTS